MSRMISTHDLHAISLFIILLVTLHISVSEKADFWCGDRQEQTLLALNGQNISLRFFLSDSLNDAQSLGWTRENMLFVRLDNQSLEYIGNVSALEGRYIMTKVADKNAFDLSIALTEQSDSGKHAIKILQGMQPLCSIVVFNVTIEATDPICSTVFEEESGRLQMYCQWVQVNVGDRAQLVAGDQVVYEYETPVMEVDGVFNLTNKISAYLTLENIYKDYLVPKKCLVYEERRNFNKTCTFISVQHYSLHEDVHDAIPLECCNVGELSNATSWWYNSGNDSKGISDVDDFFVVKADHISFLCGAEKNDVELYVWSIGNLYIANDQQNNISLSKESSSSESRCVSRYVQVATLRNDINTSQVTPNQDITPTEILLTEMSNCSEIFSKNDKTSKYNKIHVIWAVIVSVLAVMFFLAVGYAQYYRTQLEKYRYHSETKINHGIEINSIISADDDGQSSDIQEQANQHSTGFGSTGAIEKQCSLDRGEASCRPEEHHSLSLKRKFTDTESRCKVHILGNSNVGDCEDTAACSLLGSSNKSPGQHNRCDRATGIPRDTAKDHLAPQLVTLSPSKNRKDKFKLKMSTTSSLATAISLPDTMEIIGNPGLSSDDMGALYAKPDMSRQINKVESEYDDPRFPASFTHHLSSNGHEHPSDLAIPLLSKSESPRQRLLTKSSTQGLPNEHDVLYAKPDMSRKTKTMDPDYDDARVPGSNCYQETQIAGHCPHGAHIYGNMITNPTDEVVYSGGSFINTSSHTFS